LNLPVQKIEINHRES